MNRSFQLGMALAFGLGGLVLAPRVAHAGISACGNIDISAQAHCTLQTGGGCTQQCQPDSCTQACAAKLEQQCNSQCSAQATTDCTTACNNTCGSQCTTTTTTDCHSSCKSSCESDCSTHCSSSPNQSDCEASCHACCSDHCDSGCTTSTTTDCNTGCQESCTASCTAKANVDCQVNCQESSMAQCKQEAANSCQTVCQQPSGAIFCDGSFVETDDVQSCVNALNQVLDVKIDVSAQGTVTQTCDGGTCTTTGNGTATIKTTSTGCSASDGPVPNESAIAVGGLAVLGLAAFGARRRRRTDASAK